MATGKKAAERADALKHDREWLAAADAYEKAAVLFDEEGRPGMARWARDAAEAMRVNAGGGAPVYVRRLRRPVDDPHGDGTPRKSLKRLGWQEARTRKNPSRRPRKNPSHSTKLFRFNEVTGAWVLERTCDADTAQQWLAVYRKDSPAEKFVLADKRPTTSAEKELRKQSRERKARKNPSRRSVTPQIYVVDLASYNAGRSRGGWVDLTGVADAEGLSEAIREVVGDADEVAVHDYEHFPNMGESPSLDDVVRIAALMSDHDPVLVKCVYGYDSTIDRVESLLEGGYGEYDDEEDFARSFVEDNGIESVGKDAINFHFDVEAYGRDAQMNGEEMPDDDMSDEEFGEYLIREHYGDDVSTMDPATQAMYFDYEGFGRDLVPDYTTIECGRKLFVFTDDVDA